MADKRDFPVIKKFDGTNFQLWKFQVSIILRAKGLFNIVNGIEVKPTSGSATELSAWVLQDAKAQMLITTSMEFGQLQGLVTCMSASDMWSRLSAIYEQKSEANKLSLQTQFFNYKMAASDKMADHIAKIESMVLDLNMVGEEVSDSAVLAKLIGSLPSKYSSLETAWDSVSSEKQTKNDLTARLLKEEMRLTSADDTSEALATITKTNTTGQKSNGKKDSTDNHKKTGKCYYCKKIGHFKQECRKLKRDRETSSGDKEGNSSSCAELMCTELDKLLPDSSDNVWLADSGASKHMTHHREWFESFQTSGHAEVRLGNNTPLPVEGKGNIRIKSFADNAWRDVLLQHVLYVPSLKKNLLSLGDAAEKGIKVTITKNTCTLFNKTNSPIAQGIRQANGLYSMIFKVVVPHKPEVNVAEAPLQVWHERLGHLHTKAIKEMASKSLVEGIKVTGNGANFFCEPCKLGKQHRCSYKSVPKRAKCPGELIHTDVCGPMTLASYSGARFFALFKDDFSGYKTVYFLKNKSDVFEKLRKFVLQANNQLMENIKAVRSDNGTEYRNSSVAGFLTSHGISHEFTAPYTPEQNGRAERDNRTIVECARAMLESRKLPKQLWAEAVNTAVYILNRTPTVQASKSTPYELWTGSKPFLGHVRVFGCDAFEHVPKPLRKKWEPKSEKKVLVGYENNANYRLFDPVSKTVSVSKDVIFNENCTHHELSEETGSEDGLRWESDHETEDDLSISDGQDNSCADEPATRGRPVGAKNKVYTQSQERMQSLRERPTQLEANAMDLNLPQTYGEATSGPQSDEWKAAIQEELQAFQKNNVWSPAELPRGRKTVGSKWVFRIKPALQDGHPRYKARLCAKGFMQRPGMDFNETYAPVVRYDSVRVLLAMAAKEDLQISQFDVKTAFLHGELQEELYMKPPEGAATEDDGSVWKLNKSLYGLKQSPRCWNQKFNDFLLQFDLLQSNADKCIYVGKSDGHSVHLALYVDDGLLLSSSAKTLEEILSVMKNHFEITVTNPDCFVGIEISRNRTEKEIFISQKAYIEQVVGRFGLSAAKDICSPADPNAVLSKSPVGVTEKSEFPYREAVGCLMFIAVVSRPDIGYAVNVASRFLENPSGAHWTAVQRIIKYLKATKTLGIQYNGKDPRKLVGYSDADFAGDVDTRRSTTGYVFLLNSGPVTWASQRQRTVSLSTTEAEYIAACAATKEAIWLRQLLKDLGHQPNDSTSLMVDNQAAIKLATNAVFHKRTKHIDVRHHFIREHIENNDIEIDYVPTEDQLADILTKPLPRDRLKKLRDAINIRIKTQD